MKYPNRIPITSVSFNDFLDPELILEKKQTKILEKLSLKKKEQLMKYFIKKLTDNDTFWDTYWMVLKYSTEEFLQEMKK